MNTDYTDADVNRAEFGDTYEIRKTPEVYAHAESELAAYMGMASAFSNSRPYRLIDSPRKSTIKPKERKRRTAKKKAAKRARKRNRKN